MNDIQNILIEIYKITSDICRKNDIRFYALGGTLLGAVRHKGFIPWDDDMDIAIPRPDYEHFLNIISSGVLPDGYNLTNWHNKVGIPRYFSRINNENTRVKISLGIKEIYEPVWLDVFPLDAMPSNKVLRWLHKYRLLYYRMKTQLSLYDEIVHQHRTSRPMYERLIMKAHEITHIGSKWDPTKMYQQAEHAACSYDYDHEDWLVNYYGTYKFQEMFPKSWFINSLELSFEDTTIPCPSEYDKVLKQMYGDYSILPSETERVQHHCMIVVSLNADHGDTI